MIRIGTRRSALALAQARSVAQLLGVECELVEIVTSGDRMRPNGNERAGGDKSRWVGELERALLADEVDLAVHSAKDLPGEQAEGLELLGAPARAGAEDVLCGARSLEELAPGARVGTSSVRRVSQLRAAREDLDVVDVRGNVDTRLAKLADGRDGLTAIVLARAGLQRLSLAPEPMATLDPARFVPAPGQGTLALQGRAGDGAVEASVRSLTDADAFACLRAERALAAALGATCNTPLGAYARPRGAGVLTLRGWVGLPDGSAWTSDEREGGDPERLGAEVAERLLTVGAGEMLAAAEAGGA